MWLLQKKFVLLLFILSLYSKFSLSVVIGTQDAAQAVALQTVSGTDYIVIAGFATIDTVDNFLIARHVVATGNLDSTFGASADGTVTTIIGTDAKANGVVIDGSNNIIAAGYSINSGT